MSTLYYKNVCAVSFGEGTTERVTESDYVRHTQKGVTQLSGINWLCYIKVEAIGGSPGESQKLIDKESFYVTNQTGNDIGLITEEEFNNA